MKRVFSAVAALCLGLVAIPANATIWLVVGSGILVPAPAPPSPPGPPLLEGVDFAGLRFEFGFFLDDQVPAVPGPPFGGTGQSANFPGSVIGFAATIGPYTMLPTATNTRSLLVVNDSSPSASMRADQFSHSAGAAVVGGQLRVPYETDAPLPTDAFIANFSFIRSQVTTAVLPAIPPMPDMLTSAAFPDPSQIWLPGLTFSSIELRAGQPTTPAEYAALPRVRFNVSQLDFQVIALVAAVPEPATWAMLIAGFGIVGATLRRRRAQEMAA